VIVVEYAAQRGPTVVVDVGPISFPGTRGGMLSSSKYVDTTGKGVIETKEGKGSGQVER
jgi:hypothetical protein